MTPVVSGSSTRVSVPSSSYKQSSTASATSENSAKFAPIPSNVLPRGAGSPGQILTTAPGYPPRPGLGELGERVSRRGDQRPLRQHHPARGARGVRGQRVRRVDVGDGEREDPVRGLRRRVRAERGGRARAPTPRGGERSRRHARGRRGGVR